MIKVRNIQGFKDSLLAANKRHWVYITSGSLVIQVGLDKFISSGSNLQNKELAFVKRTRDYFLRNFGDMEPLPFTNASSNYIRGYKRLDQIDYSRGMIEFDINGAWWECAKKLGYFDYHKGEEIYENGKSKYRKIVRLVALGSIARNKKKYFYSEKKKKYELVKIDCNKTLRSIFFHINSEFDRTMGAVSEEIKKELAFYWVDAFVCQIIKGLKDRVEELCLHYGYNIKVKNLSNVRAFKSNYSNIYRMTCREEGKAVDKSFVINYGDKNSRNSIANQIVSEYSNMRHDF